MANLKALAAIAFSALWLSSCASRVGYEVSAARRNSPTIFSPRLHGRVQTAEGWLELEELSARPTILVFGQDLCAVCGHEADALVASLSVAGLEPSRVRLVSILVGASPEDARDWKADHRVPWSVGMDPDSTVFASYCAERTVPCNVVFVPGQGIVMNQNSPTTPEELRLLTGPWDEGD
jgi:hypothetical protein